LSLEWNRDGVMHSESDDDDDDETVRESWAASKGNITKAVVTSN